MVVRIVVILSDILAGTAVGVMKNVHQDNTTRITSGTYTAEMQQSRRRRNENTAFSFAKDPDGQS